MKNYVNGSSKMYVPRCYESHKEIELGGGVVLGASCISPKDGFNVYVGFDYGMQFRSESYPWSDTAGEVIEFMYRITDRKAPSDLENFHQMIHWLSDQLKQGQRIHMGCIGGHGRTGTVLAALYHYVTGEKDAIKWVRANHCPKAVESEEQVNFLQKHFGIMPAEPSKKLHTPAASNYSGWGNTQSTFSFIESDANIYGL